MTSGNCGLVTFTEEILNRKLHFLCNENSGLTTEGSLLPILKGNFLTNLFFEFICFDVYCTSTPNTYLHPTCNIPCSYLLCFNISWKDVDYIWKQLSGVVLTNNCSKNVKCSKKVLVNLSHYLAKACQPIVLKGMSCQLWQKIYRYTALSLMKRNRFSGLCSLRSKCRFSVKQTFKVPFKTLIHNIVYSKKIWTARNVYNIIFLKFTNLRLY